MPRLAQVLLLVCGGLLPAVALSQAGNAARAELDQQAKACSVFGRAYVNLADFRDQGADRSVAINRTTEYLNKRGQTGSHLPSKQHRATVQRFADFVYARKDLQRESLYMYGVYACALSRAVTDDAAHEQSVASLDRTLVACQRKHPGKRNAESLGECVSGELDALAQRYLKPTATAER